MPFETSDFDVFNRELASCSLSNNPAFLYPTPPYFWTTATDPPFPPPTASTMQYDTMMPDSTVLVAIPHPDNHSPSTRKYARYPAIEFWVGDKQGVRLMDALQGNFAGLSDPIHEAMNATSAKVSYKIEWLGYKPLSRQKYARRVKGLQSRSKIAKQVAEVVSEFVNDRARCATSHPRWRVGRGSIEYENLYLMEIKRVSQSTWVPVLAYAT